MTEGEKIKQARERKKMTRTQLARRMGVSYDQVYQWETDRRHPKLETLCKISCVLEMSIMWFLPEGISKRAYI